MPDKITDKPEVELVGRNGNIFNLLGIATKALRREGYRAEAEELKSRVLGGEAKSYHEALAIIQEYVEAY
jgi:hypothetical protein